MRVIPEGAFYEAMLKIVRAPDFSRDRNDAEKLIWERWPAAIGSLRGAAEKFLVVNYALTVDDLERSRRALPVHPEPEPSPPAPPDYGSRLAVSSATPGFDMVPREAMPGTVSASPAVVPAPVPVPVLPAPQPPARDLDVLGGVTVPEVQERAAGRALASVPKMPEPKRAPPVQQESAKVAQYQQMFPQLAEPLPTRYGLKPEGECTQAELAWGLARLMEDARLTDSRRQAEDRNIDRLERQTAASRVRRAALAQDHALKATRVERTGNLLAAIRSAGVQQGALLPPEDLERLGYVRSDAA